MSDSAHKIAEGAAGVPDAQQLVYTFLTGRAETTLRAYRRDVEDFRRFRGSPTSEAAVASLLGAGMGQGNALAYRYRAHLLTRKLQPATVNRRLAALRSLVKLARLFGLVAWELETPNVRHEAYRDTRGPGEAAVRAMLKSAGETDTAIARRNHAILHLLYDLGLRRGEVASLDLADLRDDRLMVMGKGRREKSPLSLPIITQQALAEWLSARGDQPGPLFLNFDRARKGDGRLSADHIYRIVRTCGEGIGVRARPHGLRHTAITQACKAAQANGIGLEEVMDFSRHKNLQVLQLYRDRERDVQGTLANLVAEAGE